MNIEIDYDYLKKYRVTPKAFRTARDNVLNKYTESYRNAKTYIEKETIKFNIIRELLDKQILQVLPEHGLVIIPSINVSLGVPHESGTVINFNDYIRIWRSRFIWYSVHDELIPEICVINHISSNKHDDRLENLKVVSWSDSCKRGSELANPFRKRIYTEDNPKIIPECSGREAEIEFFNRVKRGDYTVNIETGEIKNNITNNYIGRTTNSGYRDIGFYYKSKTRQLLIHRVIWMVANDKLIPDGYYVNHIDGNKQNNNYKNLELVTAKENTKHATELGLKFVPTTSPNSKLTYQDAGHIKSLYFSKVQKYSIQQLADMYKVNKAVISDIVQNKTFKEDYKRKKDEFVNSVKEIKAINSDIKHEIVTNMDYKKYRRKILNSFKDKYKKATTYEEKEQIKFDIIRTLLNKDIYRIDYNTGKIYAGIVELGTFGKYGKLLSFCSNLITITTSRFVWYSVHDNLIPKGHVLVHINNNYDDDRLENLEILETSRKYNHH